MALLKDRVGIEVVGGVTGAAPIDRQLTLLGCAMNTRVGHRVAAVWAPQTLGMEIV